MPAPDSDEPLFSDCGQPAPSEETEWGRVGADLEQPGVIPQHLGCAGSHLGWVAPLLLVLVGLFVTNLTIVRRGVNPFPFVATGAHFLAVGAIALSWKRQSGCSRVLSGIVLIAGVILGFGNLADGISRWAR